MTRLTAPRRYQLKKEALRIVEGGHPWLYRNQMSSAAEVFADGQWLRLVDGQNHIIGHGMYEAEGAIAVRLLRRGVEPPGESWVARSVEEALQAREELRKRTNAFRVIHGENDGIPAVVLDVFGELGVLQTYSRGADALGRLVAARVRQALDLSAVVWKPTRRRRDPGVTAMRCVFGSAPGKTHIREDGLVFVVDVTGGQKTGAFLDLRGLRRWIAAQALGQGRMLNLFSYTGTLGLAAKLAGAAEIWHVDSSASALAFGRVHHDPDARPGMQDGQAQPRVGQGCTARWITADVFEWLPRLDRGERFELVVVDPPLMTSRAADVPRVLATYRRLYRQAAAHVSPGGWLVACCCTSRVRLGALQKTLDQALGPRFRLAQRLPPEPDHPVRFAEGDYLKILIYEDTTRAAAT